MRTDIVHPEADKLTYEIREIVSVATQIETLGQEIVWENIGDPVAKGQIIPQWMKQYIQEAVGEDKSYGYSPTKGVKKTRQFIADRHNETSPTVLGPENILFFNGLGDAISTMYSQLHPQARVIGPDPAYSSHATAEATCAGAEPVMYKLDPESGWQIDINDLREKIAGNENIVAILLINPGNPTGAVFTRQTLEAVVDIADRYDLFLIVDAIYQDLRFGEASTVKTTDLLNGVPTLVMRGLSKEMPWPGARCGWMEFYNTDNHPEFASFCKTLVNAKMREVCSTTLPQQVLPDILADERWPTYIEKRNDMYEKRADILAEALADVDGVKLVKPNGAYYASIVFAEDVLTSEQTLPIDNEDIRSVIRPLVEESPLDKRFVYYLLASEGICVVPLSSGFHSRYHGFRMTLLESDINTFKDTVTRIAKAVTEYINS